MDASGKALFERPVAYNMYRAPTDNDRSQSEAWRRFHWQEMIPRIYAIQVEKEENNVCIISDGSLGWLGFDPSMRMKTKLRIYGTGEMKIFIQTRMADKRPSLPRFGLRMFLPKSFAQMEYLGYGPEESYLDKRQSSYWGRFAPTIDALYVDYIRPQENGSHCGCTWVQIANTYTQLGVYAQSQFSFNASRYTQEELELKGTIMNWNPVAAPCCA